MAGSSVFFSIFLFSSYALLIHLPAVFFVPERTNASLFGLSDTGMEDKRLQKCPVK